MPLDDAGDDTVLALQGLVKHFGGVRALDKANLRVRKGTVHGLVGQNGAGKSTLIKILAGLHRPDAGSITIAGRSYAALTPRQIELLGVHFIYQDRLLVPAFTVGEMLFLGRELRPGRLPLLSRGKMKRTAGDLVRQYFDVELPLDRVVTELTPAEQQIVQITRALLRDPTVLVLDEPTAALAKRETDQLFTVLRRLRRGGLMIGQGRVFDVPVPLYIVALSITVFFVLLNATRYGRSVLALGAQPLVAWYSGLNVRRDTAIVYVLSACICGVAGIVLSATIKAYVPLSGNAYLLDAIGAAFIETTLSAESRPSVLGTVLGVLFLSVVTNGLLLIGWSFPWQNVGTGVVIFLVLALSYSSRRLAAAR